MFLFSGFRITDRGSRQAYHQAQAACLVPLSMIALFFVASSRLASPTLWCALGMVLGSQLVLIGAYHLHTTRDRLSAPGRRLADSVNRWFPFLLVIVQNINAITSLILLWAGAQWLGLAIPLWVNLDFILLLLLMPSRRLLRELALATGSARYARAADVAMRLTIITATLFITTAVTFFLFGRTLMDSKPAPTPLLVIWVLACFVILMAGFSMFRPRTRTARPPPSQTGPTANGRQ